MKNIILLSAIAATTAFAGFAYEETKEIMVVTLADGQTAEFEVAQVKNVAFETRTETTAFEVTAPDGGVTSFETIPTLYRAVPAADGEATRFGFGPVESETPAGLCAGPYAVEVSLTNSVLYRGLTDIAENSESVVVVLRSYDADGAVADAWEKVESGTISTVRNAKGEVTLTLDATFDDGTRVYADFSGRATDVESLADLNPAPVYFNELVYFNADGNQINHVTITGVKRTTYHGLPCFTFEFDSDDFGEKTQIVMAADYFGKEVFLPDVPKPASAYDDAYVQLNCGRIQIASPNDMGRMIATNAFAKVVDNGDGTWTFDADATNTYYTSSSSTVVSGTPERVVFNFTGTVK